MLVVAALLGLAGYAADSALQSRELDHLLARAAEARSSVEYADGRVAATVEYTRPLLFASTVPPRVRRGLQQLIEDAASGQVAALQAERARADATSVLPWHPSRQRARAALVRYLDTRIGYLRTVATDADALYLAHPELESRLQQAKSAFRAAAGVGGQQRVERAFR